MAEGWAAWWNYLSLRAASFAQLEFQKSGNYFWFVHPSFSKKWLCKSMPGFSFDPVKQEWTTEDSALPFILFCDYPAFGGETPPGLLGEEAVERRFFIAPGVAFCTVKSPKVWKLFSQSVHQIFSKITVQKFRFFGKPFFRYHVEFCSKTSCFDVISRLSFAFGA